MIPGLTPAAVRAMTPDETGLLVAGWNEAQRPAMPPAPSADTLDALMARYPDTPAPTVPHA